jgi:hypothetical protein
MYMDYSLLGQHYLPIPATLPFKTDQGPRCRNEYDC